MTRIAAILAMLMLAGCAAFAPPRPLTTEAEAIAVHGQPTRRWDNGDGTTTLEYSTQPYGHTTLMVAVDASGVVLHQENALSDANLAKVKRGMTKDEVARLLGSHRSVQTFALSGEEVWDWNIYNDGPGFATLFNVHFIDGRVVRTSRSYEYPPDGMLSGYGMFGGFAYAPFPYYGHHAFPYPLRARRWPGYPGYAYPW